MNDLELAYQQMRAARNLIGNFCVIDPTLWPILSEIDTALTRGLPTEHRVLRLPKPQGSDTSGSEQHNDA